jgi:hypothetical protein
MKMPNRVRGFVATALLAIMVAVSGGAYAQTSPANVYESLKHGALVRQFEQLGDVFGRHSLHIRFSNPRPDPQNAMFVPKEELISLVRE